MLDALRAGVVNYSAAARHLSVEGDEESIATALRRYADELDTEPAPDRRASVRLRRGVGLAADSDVDAGGDAAIDDGDAAVDDAAADGDAAAGGGASDADQLLAVGDVALHPDGDLTAVVATGDVDPSVLEAVLGRLRAADLPVEAAAVAGDELLVAVGGRAGPETLRLVEDALD